MLSVVPTVPSLKHDVMLLPDEGHKSSGQTDISVEIAGVALESQIDGAKIFFAPQTKKNGSEPC